MKGTILNYKFNDILVIKYFIYFFFIISSNILDI